MRRSFLISCTLVLFLSAFHPGAWAADIASPSPTLLAAMAQANIEAHPTLVVDGEKMAPKRVGAPATPGDTVRHVADSFGMTADLFGDLRAVGPVSMFRYNEDPKDPNPFEDMDADTILPLLIGSLSDDQWRLLTGTPGLGLADLTTDDQRAFFTALLPKGKARISTGYAFSADAPGLIDITDLIPGAKLHLGLKAQVTAPLSGSQGSFSFADDPAPPGTPTQYHFFMSSEDDLQETLFGIPVRARVANTLKKGDLDWSLTALTSPVSTSGVKTVGDLVTRIGWTTGLELYADRTLEKKSVALLGGNGAAKASDLLQSLAYALSGTYRHVGGAYVLTDNLLGRTVLWRRWSDVETLVHRRRDEIKEEIAKNNGKTRSVDDLAIVKSGDDLTEAQRHDLTHPKQGYPGDITISYQDASPAQKSAILHNRALIRQFSPETPAPPPSAHDQVEIHIQPAAYLTTPGLDGQIDVNDLVFLSTLFPVSPVAPPPDASENAAPGPVPPVAAEQPQTSLAAAVHGVGRRAVLAQPKTPKEVDALVDSMHAAGLNELWVDVFSQGESLLSTAGAPNSPDILTEALRVGPKAGIRIVPTIDLYLWGKEASEGMRDRNLYGDDALEADARQMRVFNDREEESDDGTWAPPLPDRLWMRPTNPDVQKTLKDLVTRLAALPGVTSMVWRTTDPPGYRVRDTGNFPEIPDLGYTEDLRLGFLRAAHTDPLDIWPNAFVGIDRYLRKDDTMQVSEFQDLPWRTFRNQAKHNALASLFQQAREAAGAKPIAIFLQQDGYNSGGSGWYGSWDDPRNALPVYHSDGYLGGSQDYKPQGDRLAQAKAQSHIALYLMPSGNEGSAEFLADEINRQVKGKAWDGFVLDIRRDSMEYRDQIAPPANPLAGLADSAAKQADLTNKTKRPT